MIVERFPEPIDALMIRDTFDEDGLNSVRNELDSFSHAMTPSGVWIADVYKDTSMSSINRLTLESFFDADFVNSITGVNSLYGIYSHINRHSTRIKHYGDGESSAMHHDRAAFTIMTFIFDNEDMVEDVNVTLQIGGETAYEHKISNNMTIIFPSSYYVAVSQVSLKDGAIDSCGLYEISSYMFIESNAGSE